MAFYLVRAQLKENLRDELYSRLDSGEFQKMRPFGSSLTKGLKGARLNLESREALWVEEDYCSPPLAQERATVLDRYFENLCVERVDEDEGWKQIEHLPPFWKKGI